MWLINYRIASHIISEFYDIKIVKLNHNTRNTVKAKVLKQLL